MSDLEKYGLTVIPGQGDGDVWRAVEVRHLCGAQNNGNHHIYVDTYVKQEPPSTIEDENGNVLYSFGTVKQADVPVIAWCSGEPAPVPLPQTCAVERTWSDKPLEEPGCNFPMWATNTYAVAVSNGPSDIVSGLHIRHADEEAGNTWGHHSFSIRFELQGQGQALPLPGGPRPGETLDEYVKRTSWDRVGVNYNADAALYVAAQRYSLGKPETPETDVVYQGEPWRVQCYVMGIVLCKVGDWGNVRFVRW